MIFRNGAKTLELPLTRLFAARHMSVSAFFMPDVVPGPWIAVQGQAPMAQELWRPEKCRLRQNSPGEASRLIKVH